MLYFFIKQLLRWYFPHFFRNIEVVSLENIPKNKGVIFAANHQNTFIDATLLAFRLKKSIYILVRSDAFKGRIINLFFKGLHLIPIYRKQDNSGNIKFNNDETISFCSELLKKKKSILIFPEGQSTANHELSPFKKGLARLAFSTQEKCNFELDVVIVPVYIHYENHFFAKKNVKIEYLDPIDSKDFKELFYENQAKAIQVLTQQVESVLRKKIEQHSYLTIKQESNQKGLWYFLGKTIFYPTFWISAFVFKLIKDRDFFLSVIAFTWLVFGGIQILFLTLIAWFFFSWQLGLILFFGLIILAKLILKKGELLSREIWRQ